MTTPKATPRLLQIMLDSPQRKALTPGTKFTEGYETCLNDLKVELAALGSEGADVRKEVGNVLDHWEQVPNDLREDPGYEPLHNALTKLYKAVRMASSEPVTPPVVLILARVVAVSKHEKSKGACRARKPTITLKLAEKTLDEPNDEVLSTE